MKIKIDRYLMRLAKDNFGYLILWILIFIMFVYSISFFRQKNDQNIFTIDTIQNQNVTYKKRIDLINQQQTFLAEGIDLDKVNLSMTRLMPEKEDMFNIVNALNQLSSSTQFQINSYAVNSIDPKSKSVSITVSGEGDRDSFLKFLQNYNLGSGRLITIDKVDYSETSAYSVKLKLNFYTSQTSTKSVGSVVNFTEQDKKLIRKIESQVPTSSAELDTDNDTDADLNYKIKDKLF